MAFVLVAALAVVLAPAIAVLVSVPLGVLAVTILFLLHNLHWVIAAMLVAYLLSKWL